MPTYRDRLTALGLDWPLLEKPDLPIEPAVRIGNVVYVSGQIPERGPDILMTGRVGRDVDLAGAQRAARLCAANILFWLDRELEGDLDRVERIAKITVHVNAVGGFTHYSQVGNAASELFRHLFGPRGDHARTAIGMQGLPADVPVEIDAIVQVR